MIKLSSGRRNNEVDCQASGRSYSKCPSALPLTHVPRGTTRRGYAETWGRGYVVAG